MLPAVSFAKGGRGHGGSCHSSGGHSGNSSSSHGSSGSHGSSSSWGHGSSSHSARSAPLDEVKPWLSEPYWLELRNSIHVDAPPHPPDHFWLPSFRESVFDRLTFAEDPRAELHAAMEAEWRRGAPLAERVARITTLRDEAPKEWIPSEVDRFLEAVGAQKPNP
jgi:hypothetical protein